MLIQILVTQPVLAVKKLILVFTREPMMRTLITGRKALLRSHVVRFPDQRDS